jgi:hypothetical protein
VAYDTVKFDCPCCNHETTEQVGQGSFHIYGLHNAPEEVIERLIDPIRQVNCEHCNERIVFTQHVIVQTVPEKWVDESALDDETDQQETWRVLNAMGVTTNMTLEDALRTKGLKFMIDPKV